MSPRPVRLLALPCAGASATMYMRWRRLLPPHVDLLPVELPGRGTRIGEPFERGLDTLVARLCEEQAAALVSSPVLFGHSMGALLAFGMARRQRALGRPLPRALVVSASPAPARRDPARFASRRGDDALIADLRRQGGTPEAVFESPELLRLTLDVLDADYRVCESHRHRVEPPLPVPLHVLAGRDDDIAPADIAAWADESTGPVEPHWFDGGHFFIRAHEAHVVDVIARAATPATATVA